MSKIPECYQHMIFDPALSLKAKGLMFTLLSLPDECSVSDVKLSKRAKGGLTKTRAGLKELVNRGYLVKEGNVYIVHEVPVDK